MKKGREPDRTAGSKLSGGLPMLHSFWGVIIDEPRVSRSFGLSTARSWATYRMSVISTVCLMKWE